MGLFDRLIQRGPTAEEPSPSWIEGTTRCLNAYIKRDYPACVAAGTGTLVHQFIPTVGAATVLGLRRLGQAQQAEELSRSLLARGTSAGKVGGVFVLFMMLLDGALDPEQFLREHTFGGTRVELTPELACQVHFYWGARLLTEERFTDAVAPLRSAAETDCGALERRLADADLSTAEEAAAAGLGR